MNELMELSLHPGGIALTKEAFKEAVKTSAPYEKSKDAAPLKILDVGCSIGTSLSALKSEFGIEAFGIDSSEKSISKARELHDDISFEICDAMSLPYNDGQFDGILSECMLTLLKDPKAALAEWSRVLKKNGFLIISGLCERDLGTLEYSFRTEFPYDAISSSLCRKGLIDKDALKSFARYIGLMPIYEKDLREELITYMSETVLKFGSLEERIKKEQEETGSSVLDCSIEYDPKKVSYTLLILRKL